MSLPALMVNSNRDSLVTWDETVQAATRIRGARLVMFYGMAHPFRNVPANPVGRAIGAWVAEIAAP